MFGMVLSIVVLVLLCLLLRHLLHRFSDTLVVSIIRQRSLPSHLRISVLVSESESPSRATPLPRTG